MASDLKPIADAVAEIEGVVDSAVQLINDLAQKVEDSKNDPAAVQAIVDGMRAQAKELADAVAAKSPPAPTPDPEVPTT